MSIKSRTVNWFTGRNRFGKGSDYSQFARDDGYQTLSGSARTEHDLYYSWQDYFLAACPIMSGSVAIAIYSGCNLTALNFTNTTNGSPLWVTKSVPMNAATSGSGMIWLDWSDGGGDDAVAAVSASLYWVDSGACITNASTLAATSTCVTGGNACAVNSSSIVQFNAPSDRDGNLVLKFSKDTGDGDDDSDDFHLFALRLRYVSDRVGKQTTD